MKPQVDEPACAHAVLKRVFGEVRAAFHFDEGLLVVNMNDLPFFFRVRRECGIAVGDSLQIIGQ